MGQAQDRTPGEQISNNLLNQYNYLLNSQAPLSVDPYANYWAFKNSQRSRRSVDDEEDQDAVAEVAAQDAAEEEESNTDDIYPDILRGQRSYVESDPSHEEEEEVVVDYRDWYENTYLPWYETWDQQMKEYNLQMMMYEAAQYKKFVPKNPFGEVSFGNPFPFYSKTAYKQSLFDDVKDIDVAPLYKSQYEAWKAANTP